MSNLWAIQQESTDYDKKYGRGGELKQMWQKMHGEIMDFKNSSSKSMDIFLHDRKMYRP